MQKLNPVRSKSSETTVGLQAPLEASRQKETASEGGSLTGQADQTSNGVNRTEFEKIVEEGIKAIPEKFLQKLNNVAIVIEDEPTPAQKKKLNIHPSWTLFGLYEGVPQARRGINYSAVLPDKITIFQKPIETAARDEKDIKEMVKNTVWHEIAHHFGMDEARVRQAEARRRKILRRQEN